MKGLKTLNYVINKQNELNKNSGELRCYKVGDVFVDKDKRGKDRKWAFRKEKSIEYAEKLKKVAELLQSKNFDFELTESKLENVLMCAERLMFSQTDEAMRLEHAFLCKDKLCPVCSWRRSRKNGQINREILAKFVEEYPKARYIQLTLTAKNVTGEELSYGFTHLTESWTRLRKYKAVNQHMLGFIRGTEVTYNHESDTYNHHMHVLIALKTTYFKSGNYLSHDDWTNLWQKALQVDYRPIVHVQRVYEKKLTLEEEEDLNDLDLTIPKGLFYALLEVSKYPMKPLNLPDDFDEMKEIEVIMYLVMGLYRKRQMGLGGEFKRIKKDLENQGKNLDEDDLLASTDEKEVIKDSKRIYVRFCNDFYKVMKVKEISREELLKEKELSPEERFKYLTYELYRETEENSG